MLMNYTFFTDPRGITLPPDVFPLVHYSTYRRNLGKYSQWGRGIIDSGVYQLKKNGKYAYLDEYPLSVSDGWAWVIPDYPHDMLVDRPGDECVARTRENLEKWADCPGAIPTFQFPMFDFAAFKRDFAAFNKRFAIGNLCRLNNNGEDYFFLKKVLAYVAHHNEERYDVHIFGLPMRGIRYLFQLNPSFTVTFDNTKWTQAVDDECRALNLKCTGEDRQTYFDHYYNIIQQCARKGKQQKRLF